MAQVAPMTKETESKLTNLLMEVVDSGDEPVSALTKIAQQAKLTPDQIRMLGRAYNTGVTLSQIKEGNTIQEKAAIVTLVDPESVIKNVFPDKVDSPAEKTRKEAVSRAYALPPSIKYKSKPVHKLEMTKAAAEEKVVSSDPRGLNYLQKRAKEKEINCTLDEGRRVLTVNIYKAAQAFDNLRDYFERAGAININYVQKSAAAVYGNIVNDIFGYVTKDIKLTKNASSATPPVKWNAVPFSFIKDAIEAIETHNAFKAKLDTIDAQLAKSANKKKVSPKDTIVGSIVDYLENKEAGLMSGVAGGAGVSIAKNTLDSLTPKPEHDRVKDIIRELDSGGHVGNLQRIKMQSFLTELMLNDPVVSEYNPNDVYEAFNYLNEVAPRTVQHPVIAKSLIRRYLSQGNNIDAFEASQLATIEKDLMRQTDSPIRDEMAFYGAPEGPRHGSNDKS